MPQMGYDMEEGTVIRWLVEEGADVALGDAVAEIETDKAAVDFESPVAGVLLKVLVAEGTTVPVGETIAVVGDAGEDPMAVATDSEGEAGPPDAPDAPDDSVAEAPAAEPAAPSASEPQAAEPQQERTAMFEDNLRASPVARKLAEEQGIDLSLIKGTGPGGRITRDDVLSFAPEPEEPEPQVEEEAPAEEIAEPEAEVADEPPAEETAEPEAEMEEEAPAEEAAEPVAEMEEEAPAEEPAEPEPEVEPRSGGSSRAAEPVAEMEEEALRWSR
jgi:pyruvate dehydrogenase E2 component (dihydrolipoamide acetyltransferase)